ncbi:tRNA (adenosine(37)-N6)-threonylcarbamoyltransferase complex ATPase subunit type 1 TsaE [Andreprevotia chitinilytica]|uniref:tRNA (adenosine(37)-N6)-threonylcarbamoyltransferase complex ATPase subunit type 1 TsaE n=1 Tax=Andreprevotia chitinilytica TaxID=396808 RepID=UPI0027E56CA5|nr:tRNA (adenosine(37)-N6)-threonylcarbamoyltransferase complex ATPase subunit type 1 TsaE [Andreprevotia chitinilytica]
MAEIGAGDGGLGKTQLLRPRLDACRDLGPIQRGRIQFFWIDFWIKFLMHKPNDKPLSVFLADEAATIAFGGELALAIRPGMTIFLEGDLGAGKTTLTRGLLRGLGFSGRVKSPTYTLVEPYAVSNLYLYHFDLYRFSDPSEWEDAGFRDYFNPESICLIEWADKAEGLLPRSDWLIRLAPEAEGRRITLIAQTEHGAACLASLTPRA